MKISYLLIPMLALMAAKCPKSTTEPDVPTSTITPTVRFVNNDGSNIYKDSYFFLSQSSQFIVLNRCDLYLSNMRFIRSDGTAWEEKNSYHLIKMGELGSTPSFSIKGIPLDEFRYVEYSFGVDSSRNRSLDKVGDLDPINGMAWDWNTGYRYLVMEGGYRVTPGVDSALIWHIGTAKNYRTVRKSFRTPTWRPEYNLNFEVNIETFFNGPHELPPNRNAQIMFEEELTGKAADNILSSISVHSF